ncbi:unnamed protein product [Ectocarpus sp. 6 AP-2014]
MAGYSSSSLPWALLFVACLMNPSRSFVVQQPALMRSSSGTAGRSSSGGGLVTEWGTLSSSAVHRAGRTQRYRGAGMKASAGAAAGEAAEDLRSGRTRLFVEARDDAHHGVGATTAIASAAYSSNSRNHNSTGGSGGGVAFLNGNKDDHASDDGGGINGGGIVGGGGGGDGEKGDGGRGDGGEGSEGDGSEEYDFVAKGRRRKRIIRKVERAIRRGKIPKECSSDYAKLLTSPLMSLLCKNSGWRARLLGDTTFMTKLAIEMVTGTAAQFLAEYQKRGKKFMQELDFVAADTLTCLFANFAAVWLSCPTVAVKAVCKKEAAKAGGTLQKFLAACPSNAFQKVVAEGGVSKTFSVAERGAALLVPMPKLFVIGFGATLAGYGLIAGLETFSAWRTAAAAAPPVVVGRGAAKSKRGLKRAQKARAAALAEEAQKPPVPVLGSGLAVGMFLAVWTNLRYQFIAGAVEQRIFDTMLAKNPGLSSLASTAVRSANLYVGSLTIVDWLRYVGVQH